jgi:sarcosine oxidase subunit alpha
MAVRTGVGVIDVSTLGGLELAAPTLRVHESLLYLRVLKQPVGRTRYAVLVSEQGVVIDDGVAARLAEDHFYVTATTGGVDRVYREMLRWNAQWRLSVDIANVTAAFSAINIAGPDSRAVLEALGCSIDRECRRFPLSRLQRGRCGGLPARLMRVGFVGELGYELTCPAFLLRRCGTPL